MMYIRRPFSPKGATVNLAVTAASQVVAVTRSGFGTQSIRIVVSGTDPVFVNFGISTTTVTAGNGMLLLPNSSNVFELPKDVTHIAAISSGTASTIYLTTGEGS